MKVDFRSNVFPLFHPQEKDDLKDPCPVFDGSTWHMFGSAGTVTTETWELFHATSERLDGPWTEQVPIMLPIQGSGIAAPGVIFADGVFHMFVQTEFMRPGGRVEHAVSNDGFAWVVLPPAIVAMEDTEEHGIYDPHPAEVGGLKYLVYSAMPRFDRVPQPDVYLARSVSNSWFGPWERLGKILDHADVPHHNHREDPDYEWGIEGAQLVELPDGRVLLNATCFLPTGERGTRQRVFFAIGESVAGPYRSVGPVLDPAERGENGHSTVMIRDNELVLFYQSRVEGTNHRWRYGIARCDLAFHDQVEVKVPSACSAR
ncbi:hypothetical protein LAC81_35125 (plasmid) [Ensifer adhaerens]|uniref:hypothetical protein n=1 Tax=Ensifer adhaerens TaxID=106592 RepID=UPI001CBE3C39|nr:hypothetical protein [Ensifer adhaerens]MBZ7927181.1 hypothetical protein [Ensifer adhaerens]UAX98214.1 hypothetical protein LAC78_36425 [Ensifer adhaerens]UAY05596.1 hypothetical protein LAC80_35130 [Ensifer adhaerens]UAY12974.1 hypothetical protein LAC81_35125 [Ensifer adhaerens]